MHYTVYYTVCQAQKYYYQQALYYQMMSSTSLINYTYNALNRLTAGSDLRLESAVP